MVPGTTKLYQAMTEFSSVLLNQHILNAGHLQDNEWTVGFQGGGPGDFG